MASRIDPGALIASALAHCVLVAAGASLFAGRVLFAPPADDVEVVLEEVPSARGDGVSAARGEDRTASEVEERDPRVEPPAPRGGAVARPDRDRSGRGGPRQGERAANLASNVDPLTLERDPLNHPLRSETQRLRSGRQRRSWDDRRATPNPMELDFVATGKGRVAERRPFASATPDRGALHGGAPTLAGAAPGAPSYDGWEGRAGAARSGGPATDPAGLSGRARGDNHYLHAEVMTARPSVPASRAAVPAAEHAFPSDVVESRQRVASRVVALMQASTLGGEQAAGVGGTDAPLPPAAGSGSGQGSRAEPWGQGLGRGDPYSDREEAFFRRVRSRIARALENAFPRWAIAEGRGGLVIFDLALGNDGRIESVALVRPSGIEEYDLNVLRAVRGLGGFGPIPAAFASRLRFTYDSRNPIVGRNGPGPGRVAN